ncbi:MAG TPA: iron ABC transporter permease [Bacillota bacterium]|nr:iron ABC transporter permease [Bacillota bacterium]
MKSRWPIIIACMVLLGSALAALKIGSLPISWHQLFTTLFLKETPANSNLMASVIWQIRLPRIILAMGVGAALAISGLAFQAVLGNYLADPYLLGVSSGASLGAIIIMTVVPISLAWLTPAAFLTGMVTVIIVLALARSRDGGLPSERMVLAGVAVGSFLTAIVSMLLIMSKDRMAEALFWLMGGFSGRGWAEVATFLPYLIIGSVVLFLLPNELNLMSLGEETAYNVGVATKKVGITVLLVGSLLAGAAVSISGVIGFVGLIVPHFTRMAVGADHRRLLPLTAIGGAFLLLAADTLARSIPGIGELPVGAVTAFLGGPFFIYLLRRSSYGGARIG